jgi:hypothetical protein
MMVSTLPDSITCPDCGMTSHNKNDVEQKYCGNCHWWTSDPVLAAMRPGLNRVSDWGELDPRQKQYIGDTVRKYCSLVHSLMLAEVDAIKEQTWKPIEDLSQAALHCDDCVAATIGASMQIISQLIYRLYPGATINEFADVYRSEFDL